MMRIHYLPKQETILSGILIVIACFPHSFWPLLGVTLIPWLRGLRKTQDWKNAGIQGLWLGFFFSLGSFYWIGFAIHEFGKIPLWLSWIGVQLFCFLNEPQFFLSAIFFYFQKKSRSWVVPSFAFACFYISSEYIIPKFFSDTLGNVLGTDQYMRQLSDFTGVSGLTWAILFLNHTLEEQWNQFRINKVFSKKNLLIAGCIPLVIGIYGFFRNNQITQLMKNPIYSIHAVGIQANIGDVEKVAAKQGVPNVAFEILQRYMSLTHEALAQEPRPTLVVWPETAYPQIFGVTFNSSEREVQKVFNTFLKQIKTTLLFGGYDYTHPREYNALFYHTPYSQIQTYRKTLLFPFSEYLPGSESFPFLKKLFPMVGHFSPGEGPKMLTIYDEITSIETSPLICYESLDSEYSRATTLQGSQLLINITNDSWFQSSIEAQQNLALTRFRAIENRTPLFRVTNTGISALILPNGEITSITQENKAEILSVSIPITQPISTLFKTIGHWLDQLAVLFIFFYLMNYLTFSKKTH